MRTSHLTLLLAASVVLGCQHDHPPERMAKEAPLSRRNTTPEPTSDDFEERSPWPSIYDFHDEDAKSFSYSPALAPIYDTYIDEAVFSDHDLRVRIVVTKQQGKETLHAVRIERLGREGYENHFMFRAPHGLPRLLHLLSRAYDTCLDLDRPAEPVKYVIREVSKSQQDSGLTYRPTPPPPHEIGDHYEKVADFTMEKRRVRLHERVGEKILFADLCSVYQSTEYGEVVYRVHAPSEIKTSEDLLTVIRLFNAAYDQSMEHLRRATPQTIASH